MKRKGLRKNRTRNKKIKEQYQEWIKAKSETDKTFKARFEYRKAGIAKHHLIKKNYNPQKLSTPKYIHYWPNKNKAVLKINPDSWKVEIIGSDYSILKGDVLLLNEQMYKGHSEFQKLFF